jgi:hypothetical protein
LLLEALVSMALSLESMLQFLGLNLTRFYFSRAELEPFANLRYSLSPPCELERWCGRCWLHSFKELLPGGAYLCR